MENNEKTTVQSKEPVKGKEERSDWGTGHCPFFLFGDEDAANYDMKKVKKFFDRFKKRK